MSGKQFATINQHPRYSTQINDRRNSSQRNHDYQPHNSTMERRHNNARSGFPHEPETHINNPNSSRRDGKSIGITRRMYRWCAQCCRKKKSKIQYHHRRKKNCFKRLREKCRRRKAKLRRTSFRDDPRPRTIPHHAEKVVDIRDMADIVDIEREKPMKEELLAVPQISSEGQKKRASFSRKLSEPSTRVSEGDMDKETAQEAAKKLDFRKSCCYLCTMANIDKLHISIQASTKEVFTSDKSCSPLITVRTVQSSVKVKTRDMSTSYQDKKKGKKIKPKLKLKNINNYMPKFKFPAHPKMKTVACETEKPRRCNNVPQCRAKRGIGCVTEASLRENDKKHDTNTE